MNKATVTIEYNGIFTVKNLSITDDNSEIGKIIGSALDDMYKIDEESKLTESNQNYFYDQQQF